VSMHLHTRIFPKDTIDEGGEETWHVASLLTLCCGWLMFWLGYSVEAVSLTELLDDAADIDILLKYVGTVLLCGKTIFRRDLLSLLCGSVALLYGS